MSTRKVNKFETAVAELEVGLHEAPATLPSTHPCLGWFCIDCDYRRDCAELNQRKTLGPQSSVANDDLRAVLDVVRLVATPPEVQDASRRLRTVLDRREIEAAVEARVRKLRLEIARENRG